MHNKFFVLIGLKKKKQKTNILFFNPIVKTAVDHAEFSSCLPCISGRKKVCQVYQVPLN